MKQFYAMLFLAFSFPGLVFADELRVLLSFSADDHRVEKVFSIESSRVRDLTRSIRSGTGPRSSRTGLVLEWLDVNGNVMADEVIADPRITHAHSPVGPIPDKFLKPNGVYLVNGPIGAKQLRLTFPAVNLSTQFIPAIIKLLPLTSD